MAPWSFPPRVGRPKDQLITFGTTSPHNATTLCCLNLKFSDHKLLQVSTPIRWKQPTHRCILKHARRWTTRTAGAPRSAMASAHRHIADAWAASSSVFFPKYACPRPSGDDLVQKARNPIDLQSLSALLAATWLRDYGWSLQLQQQQQWHHQSALASRRNKPTRRMATMRSISHKLGESWRLMAHFSGKRKEGCIPFKHTTRTRSVQFRSQRHPKEYAGTILAVLIGSGILSIIWKAPWCATEAHALLYVWQAYGRFGSHLFAEPSEVDSYVAERPTSSAFWILWLQQLSDTVELPWKERRAALPKAFPVTGVLQERSATEPIDWNIAAHLVSFGHIQLCRLWRNTLAAGIRPTAVTAESPWACGSHCGGQNY